ncbi:MAG: cupin [Gracilibacter sp. BRH_c7a]|nr:MAG: cupin [Gracilibacter sp. BRH_c7a]
MIKKSNELRMDYVPNLKGGKDTVKIINILENEDNYGGRLFGISIIPVGGSIGYHQHIGDFETYYILKGKALINDNGNEQVLNPGDMTHCKDGDWHSIENVGDCELEYVAVILYNKEKK